MPIEFENSPEYDLHSSVHAAPIIDQYQTEHQIISGEFSSVYIVRNRFTGERFTLKAIRKTEGIIFDFNKLIRLKHENIVTMSAHYETEKFHYIIKPYVEGIDLHKFVDKNGPLDRQKINALTKQLTSAIKYLHDRKEPLIFRDLKPSNIIIEDESADSEFKITLIDIETMRQKNNIKRADTYYVMSHGYTSPEQYGYRQTDVRSDIYSLGATLYFAITGIEPNIKENIAKTCIEKNSHIDKRLALAVERCLAFDPENRYKDIFAFERALKRTDYMPLLRKNSVALSAVLFLTLGISFAFSLDTLREFDWFNENQTTTTPPESSLEIALNTAPPEKKAFTLNLPRPYELMDPSEDLTENPADLTLESVSNLISSSQEPAAQPATQTVTTPVTEPATSAATQPVTQPMTQANTQPVTQPVTQPKTQPVTQATTDAPTQASTEPATQSTSTSTVKSYNGLPVIASHSGITITSTRDQNYTIWANRNQLTDSQKDFVYMSVYSYEYNVSELEFSRWAQDAVDRGYGFQYYADNIGYASMNHGHHYVVFLFDTNKNLVGTMDFRNIR